MADGVFASVDAGLRGTLVRHHLAVLAREEGQYEEAKRHWRAVLDDNPVGDAGSLAYPGLIELYLQQGRWPEVETLPASQSTA